MKLPIPKLCDTPDSDGVCRSEAEIDHLEAVEEGGSDHQSNLGTKCVECHKNKHKKRLTKIQREDVKKIIISLQDYM